MTAGSSGAPSGGGGTPTPPINWVSLINKLGTLGQQAAQDFTTSAATSAGRARAGNYGTDEWLQDLQLFWDNLAKYAKAGIDAYRDQLPKKP